MLVAGSPSDRITFAARQVGAAARSSIPVCAQPSAVATMAKVLPGARLADHDGDSLGVGQKAVDHLALICLEGRTSCLPSTRGCAVASFRRCVFVTLTFSRT